MSQRSFKKEPQQCKKQTRQLRPQVEELKHYGALVLAGENEQISPPLELDQLDTLDYHGITLLVKNCIRDNDVPSPLSITLKQRRALAISNEALLKQALAQTFDACAKAGLKRFVVFKGTALAYSVYPKAWLRPRSDCDLLINSKDLNAFKQMFEKLGFSQQFGISGNYVSYQQTFNRPLVGDSTLNIDLHWRISNRQCLANTYEVEDILLTSQSLTEIHSSANIPSAIDSLLIACLHRLGHHASEERIAWLYDIHLLAQSLNTSEWHTLTERAQSKQLCSITIDALRLCTQVFATRVPNKVIETLQQTISNAALEPSQFLLQRDLPQWRYFLHDVKSIHSLRAKFAFVRETMLPSHDYLRQKTGTQWLVIAYFKRFKQGIRRLSRN